jgi:hypothetical protein
MKKTGILIFVIWLSAGVLWGQFVPDDFVPGLRELTAADWEFLNSLESIKLSDLGGSRELPASLDNSVYPWMRPVFNQDGGSCGQASGIGYAFTYEINRLRDLSADVPENQYADHYTWNFLNGGFGGGSWHFDGWQIVKAGGCPSVATYGGMFAYGQSGWMNGYDNYRSAMENRITEIIEIDVSTGEGLEVLKTWFYEHCEEEESGGLVCFAAGVSDLDIQILSQDSPYAGQFIITDWTEPVNHAMTFVGYDDEVCYDYNGDGIYTNDIDINDDGIIDMRDWEIGALKMVNSWGLGWGNGGYCWVMYKTLAESTEDGGIWGNFVHGIRVRDYYEPLLTLKAEISHNVRNTLRIGAGVSSAPGAIEPEVELYFPHFNFQGGEWNLPGNNLPGAQSLEIGLDVTPLLSELQEEGEMQWWICVESVDPDNVGEGSVINYSFHSETGSEEEIFTGSQTNWSLINNWVNYLNVSGEIDYEPIEIITEELPWAYEGIAYEVQLIAAGGNEPFIWQIKRNYTEEPGCAAFPQVDWQQIEVTDNDDGWAEIDLPFSFYFYNDAYNAVSMLTDGSLYFGGGFAYIRTAENMRDARCISGYGSDLMAYPESGDGYYYYGDDDVAMFRWRVSKYANESFNTEFVIALWRWDEIEIYYNVSQMTPSGDWVAGVSYGDGVSWQLSSNSGNVDFGAIDEVTNFDFEPFPRGEFEISNEGLMTGDFWGNTHFDNPFRLDIIVTDSYNIYDEKILDLNIATMPATDNEIAAKAELAQNYPNPFMAGDQRNFPGTRITYNISEGSEIRLGIYNLRGQLVRNLVEDYQMPGCYEVIWNGKNDKNEAVSSGVYFYRLQHGKNRLSRKLLLVK